MIVLTAAAVALAADVGSKAAVVGDGRVRVLLNRRAPISVARASALLALVTVVVLAAAPTGLTAAGLGLAIGGAAGNVVDRARHGAVTDFVSLGRWPTFNLADAAMTVGIALAAVSVL